VQNQSSNNASGVISPIMFSRRSSVQSLDSCIGASGVLQSEMQSAYTTHVHTGLLSPSDLPDSPCGSGAHSPRAPNYAQGDDGATQCASYTANMAVPPYPHAPTTLRCDSNGRTHPSTGATSRSGRDELLKTGRHQLTTDDDRASTALSGLSALTIDSDTRVQATFTLHETTRGTVELMICM
jgi:hypothetical protein